MIVFENRSLASKLSNMEEKLEEQTSELLLIQEPGDKVGKYLSYI